MDSRYAYACDSHKKNRPGCHNCALVLRYWNAGIAEGRRLENNAHAGSIIRLRDEGTAPERARVAEQIERIAFALGVARFALKKRGCVSAIVEAAYEESTPLRRSEHMDVAGDAAMRELVHGLAEALQFRIDTESNGSISEGKLLERAKAVSGG